MKIVPIIDKNHTIYLIKNNKWKDIIYKYNMIKKEKKINDDSDNQENLECIICFETNVNCLTNCNHHYCYLHLEFNCKRKK